MSLEQAIEDNTKTLRELIALIRETPVGKFLPYSQVQVVTEKVVAASSTTASTPAATDSAPAATAVTYDVLKTAFLALIRQLGSAEAAKAAVLTPLGLSDLKSNEGKPDLFPAIMEKITQAKAAV
jgi:hypothetical protein